MNKKVFHCNGKTILTIAVTSLLVGCNSELDLASYQQKEEYPSSLIEISEGKDFMDYCSKNKKEAFLFFAKLYFVNKEKTVAKEISYNMFCTLFTEYADIIEKVKLEWKEKQYDEKGAYIAPLPETFLKEYVKKLIDKII